MTIYIFSFLATITEVAASPVTLSEVTNISIGLLIAKKENMLDEEIYHS